VKTSGWVVRAVVIGALAVVGCEAPVPTVSPTPFADQPGIQIDPTWRSADGEWTFTGAVDPKGDPTDVVLEVGPGPVTARRFDQQIPVVQDVTDRAPLTITTQAIPDIDEICVRFTATNGAGTSWSTPLCFPHDLPSFVVDAEPPVTEFSAPAPGTVTVLTVTTYTVSWTETETGTGISRRSLQRQVAIDAAGTCGAFEDDGPAETTTSPVAVTGLLDGRCYQWIQALADGAGNTSATTSGTVRVDSSP
jgi:hypothetical protein